MLELPEAAAELIRRWVAAGGLLIATGRSSLRNGKFLLEDVLGARYAGKVGTKITYMTPQDASLQQAIWPQDHLSFAGPMHVAQALPGAQVLARLTLPFVQPELGTTFDNRFAAIHSNPPGLKPEQVGDTIVLNNFGKGHAAWLAAPLELSEEAVNIKLLGALVHRMLAQRLCAFDLDAHPTVEMTVFDQPENSRVIATLLNLQSNLPPLPVSATVRLLPPAGRHIVQIRRAPDLEPVPFSTRHGRAEFQVPPFECLRMFVAEYQ